MEIEIRSEAECEEADAVVCGDISYFPDDVKTTCAWCKKKIVHRPHVPKRPPKVCISCMVLLSKAESVQ